MPSAAEPRYRRLLLLLVAGLAAATGAFVSTGNATAASPTMPTSMVITGITSSVAAPAGTPSGAVPYVLVEAGGTFDVTVAFYNGTTPAAFNSDTTLKITSTAGTLSPATGVAPAKATSVTLTTSLASAANQVGLTVTVASGPAKGLTTGEPNSAQRFDVLSDLRFEDSSADFQQGIGGETNCANATRADPVCGLLLLPSGAVSSQVLLSLGVCDATYANCGSNKGVVVQALANLSGLYPRSTPATLVIKCDKTLCGTGAIQSKLVNFSLLGNAALGAAPACPAKGTVGDLQTACVDYVQSKRDGSGDTHLYLLFVQDIRGSIG
jgi:hypothetical protein